MNQCAVVTGAAGGIGRAICERLSGADVAVLGIDVNDPGRYTRTDDFLRVDLGRFAESEVEAAAVVRDIVKWLAGRNLRLLVNNAAVQRLGEVEELDRQLWRHSLGVNLLGPFFLTQALLSKLKEGRGCVVNISSIHARATKPGFVAYATTKAALSGLTRALAVEVGRHVPIYGIEPGAVLTEMLRDGFAQAPESLGELAACHPSGEIATPEELADLVHFLFESRPPALQGSAIEFGGGISGRLHDPE